MQAVHRLASGGILCKQAVKKIATSDADRKWQMQHCTASQPTALASAHASISGIGCSGGTTSFPSYRKSISAR